MPTVAIRTNRSRFGHRYRRALLLQQGEIDRSIPTHFNGQHPDAVPMDDTVAMTAEIPQSDVDSR